MKTAATEREKQILERVTEILKLYLRPAKIILFGSRGKGIPSSGSDFDFAVDKPRPELTTERKINGEIEEVSGLYHVDVVYLGSVDKEFKKVILRTGKTIYERRTFSRSK